MTRVSARPGAVRRLVLREPVALYLGIAGSLLIVAALVVAARTGEWLPWLSIAAGADAVFAVAGWAARASVYSQASHIGEMIASRGSWTVSFADQDARR